MKARYHTRFALGVGVILGLSACQSTGEIDNPVVRKLTWFSYANGDDIRDNCQAAAPTVHRMIYNGIYNDQIRIYNVAATPRGASLDVRVIEGALLGRLEINRAADVLDPWRGVTARTVLRPADFDLLNRALKSAGVGAGAPVGLRLHSDDFYWLVGSCVEGRFSYAAYRWPSARFDGAASFADLLGAWDATGIAVNPPRRIDRLTRKLRDPSTDENQFTLQIGANGLLSQKGGGSLF